MRRIGLAAAVIVGFVAIGLQVAPASEGPRATVDAKVEAKHLATRSLEYLRRGEDATTKEEKLAAYRQGLELARRAIELNDGNADAHFGVFANGGRIMLLQGATPNPINLLKVNHELERALELNPDHADALAAKGGLYRQLPWVLGGSLSVAESCLAKAIAIDPEAVGARIELAETYRDMGQPERGLPLLRTAAAIAERQGKRRQLNEAQSLLRQLKAP